jgi:hypothetical protein
MSGSFIGKKEINDFLNTLDNNKENSLFKYEDDAEPKNISQNTECYYKDENEIFQESSYR